MNLILDEIKKVQFDDNDLQSIKGKTFLVTGGNGLIGSYLLCTLAYINNKYDLNINLIGTLRNIEKNKSVLFNEKINWIIWDLNSPFELDTNVDYIIHTANSTSSKFFVEKPVELINSATSGFNAIMNYARKHRIQSAIFTSSLEVYGLCNEDKCLKENELYPIDPSSIRSGYPLSKKIIENLCVAYGNEYNIPIKIVRLGQTFAPGVPYNDERVFSDFARKIANDENITLLTKGKTKRSYCSIPDCILGIFKVLLYGKTAESYNLVSDNSYISIYELAKLFINNTNLKVIINEQKQNQFLPTIKFAIDTTKIKELGFKSVESIEEMVINLKRWFQEKKNIQKV